MATADEEYKVNAKGLEEVVADRDYHGNEALVGLQEPDVRTYVAERERGKPNWEAKPAERAAVYGNRPAASGSAARQADAETAGRESGT